jgi:hypothetical protein
VLTDERGAFFAPVAAGGRYRIRALRIGYQPTVLDAVVEPTGTTALRVVLGVAAVALPSVTVRGEDICRGTGAEGAVVAQVWEEARKALLASGLSAAEPLVAEWIEYERTLDTTARVVREQRVRSTRTTTTHVPQRLAGTAGGTGYVVDTDDGRCFTRRMPTCASDAFASHCATSSCDGGRPGMIVSASGPPRSTPVQRYHRHVLDRSREQRASSSIAIRIFKRHGTAAGGLVEFLRLPSGSVGQSLGIRMPQLVTVILDVAPSRRDDRHSVADRGASSAARSPAWSVRTRCLSGRRCGAERCEPSIHHICRRRASH